MVLYSFSICIVFKVTHTNSRSSTPCRPSVGIREGSSLRCPSIIPPIPVCVLEKIHKCKYIDLESLLEQQDGPAQNITACQSGQLVVIKGTWASRQTKPINNILTRLHAFSIYMAALVSADTTSKEEAAGLAAYLHLIMQLAKDLGGSQWLAYDQHFREWAAASGVKK